MYTEQIEYGVCVCVLHLLSHWFTFSTWKLLKILSFHFRLLSCNFCSVNCVYIFFSFSLHYIFQELNLFTLSRNLFLDSIFNEFHFHCDLHLSICSFYLYIYPIVCSYSIELFHYLNLPSASCSLPIEYDLKIGERHESFVQNVATSSWQ